MFNSLYISVDFLCYKHAGIHVLLMGVRARVCVCRSQWQGKIQLELKETKEMWEYLESQAYLVRLLTAIGFALSPNAWVPIWLMIEKRHF